MSEWLSAVANLLPEKETQIPAVGPEGRLAVAAERDIAVGFQTIAAAVKKYSIFWGITLFSMVKVKRFRRICHLQLQS
jgi:hypothetical protein